MKPASVHVHSAAALLTLLGVLVCTTNLVSQDYQTPPGDFSNAIVGDTGVALVKDRAIPYFEVINADAPSVFKQLSTYSGVDIVFAPTVKDKIVNLSLTNKSWKEILLIVCKTLKLSAIREEAYIYVLPTDEFRAQQESDSKNLETMDISGPLEREIIRLNNVPAGEMQVSIRPLLSNRGKITIVERNNAMIIFDTKENIGHIKRMVESLDIENDQVSISCKIIEVGSGTLQNMGVQWGYFDKANIGSATGKQISVEHLPGTKVITDALEKLTFGVMSQDRFAVTLEYLFTNNKAEIVAQPQITTVDNKEARIFMGQQVPVTTKDVAGNTIIQMIEAGTELTVTPHLTTEKRITLELLPKKKSYELKNNLPVINEQSAYTNVVVNDGETVVIAGLTSNEKMEADGGIPILKDIPFLGYLFKTSKKSHDKRDLIIFVTPHIIYKSVQTSTGK